MEQTAVEWLVANIDWQLLRTTKTHKAHYNMIVEQAKEMEKEHISNAMLHGWRKALDEEVHSIDPNDFYNKTFKSE